MENWQARRTITVVFTDQALGHNTLNVVAQDEMVDAKVWESQYVSYSGSDPELELEVVNSVNDKQILEEEHLQEVLRCLYDHIANVDHADWLSHQNDLLVDEAEWLWVDVSYGIYYAMNVRVRVYYVSI